MRCICLANELKHQGHRAHFICRELSEPFSQVISKAGHLLTLLPPLSADQFPLLPETPWATELQQADAQASVSAMTTLPIEWLIVDHYGLDFQWETILKPHTKTLLSIDDLGHRHNCDLLLDQNIYPDAATRYLDLVPMACQRLIGPQYALLRPEFATARMQVQPRKGEVKHLLVCMGGMDRGNLTQRALEALLSLDTCPPHIDVVIGAQHPATDHVAKLCNLLHAHLHVQTQDMAYLSAKADLAIGAGGISTWERCSLGLPALVLVVANNQANLAANAAAAGLIQQACRDSLTDTDTLTREIESLIKNSELRHKLSINGIKTVDGQGRTRVVEAAESIIKCNTQPVSYLDGQALRTTDD